MFALLHRSLWPAGAILVLGICCWSRSAGAQDSRGTELSAFDQVIQPIVARMTLDEKVGQMTQPDQDFVKDLNDIEKLYIGSILSGGDSDPKEGNSREAWAAMYDRCQQAALRTRLRIPLLYGVDAVHGHNNVLGAVVFPQNIALGCTRNPDLVEQVGRITALEVRATGINWTFAPCVTVPQDIRWGRTYEGFSEDPQLAGALGAAAVRGLQTADLKNPEAIAACVKHYLGDGGTVFGTSQDKQGLDQGDMRVDEPTLRKVHLAPYLPAIRAGGVTIMPSYSSWNGLKMSANKYLLTDVLKGELGFDGFLISDYNAIDQVAKDYKDAVRISINAGMDMVMVPSNYKAFIANLKTLVNEGAVPMSRIDDAVTRILRVKAAMGLLDPQWQPAVDPQLVDKFGSVEHRAVAREAVRQSVVLLKNAGPVLPLSKAAKRIHVAGRAADNLGMQCGGWTIKWQGQTGNVTTGGTTILQALKQAVSPQTTIDVSTEGQGVSGADVAVVVVGEDPYAEFKGDRADLRLSEQDLTTIRNVKSAGVPMVVVLLSGRPMILDGVLDQADAVLAAWLPGTEGAGVTDVLFGDYQPTGKLSFTWPASMDQLPTNINQLRGKPLFAYGFGLTWTAN
jgi:beta-glucosidase